ncbi:MAG: AraC family transcriptional regulator [Paenibacillaceae bacterium]|nr:AraC family transcriptional regulator [Paenibacillaceae bacterium]
MKEFAAEYADIWRHMPSRYERAGGFWLVRAGRNAAKPNYQVGPKQIDSFGLHFIVSGQLRLGYENEAAQLQAGDLFCLFPHISYEYRTCSAEPLQMVWLTMEGPQTGELMKMLGVTAHKPYRFAAMDETVRQFLREVEQVIWDDEQKQRRRLTLMSAVYRLMEQLEADHDDKKALVVASAEDWVEEAMRFLQLHYTEPLRIEAVANMFGVHRSYFSHLFTRKVGISPQQYLQQLRLSRAKQLLSDHSLQVGEIALSAGYPDLYMFSRAFKKQVGCSPSEYRHQEK